MRLKGKWSVIIMSLVLRQYAVSSTIQENENNGREMSRWVGNIFWVHFVTKNELLKNNFPLITIFLIFKLSFLTNKNSYIMNQTVFLSCTRTQRHTGVQLYNIAGFFKFPPHYFHCFKALLYNLSSFLFTSFKNASEGTTWHRPQCLKADIFSHLLWNLSHRACCSDHSIHSMHIMNQNHLRIFEWRHFGRSCF